MGQLILLGLFGALIIAFGISLLAVSFAWFYKRNPSWVFCFSFLAGWMGLSAVILSALPHREVIKFDEIERVLVTSFFAAFPCAALLTFLVYLFRRRDPSEK
jgi:hypothetical protein